MFDSEAKLSVLAGLVGGGQNLSQQPLRKKHQPCLPGGCEAGQGRGSKASPNRSCSAPTHPLPQAAEQTQLPSKPAWAGLVEVAKTQLKHQFVKEMSYYFWDQQGPLCYLIVSGGTPNEFTDVQAERTLYLAEPWWETQVPQASPLILWKGSTAPDAF